MFMLLLTSLLLLLFLSRVLTAISQPLSELEHLNLGYNCLQRAPTLNLSARAKLVTLNLRNNELETINGKAGGHRACSLCFFNTCDQRLVRSDRRASLRVGGANET